MRKGAADFGGIFAFNSFFDKDDMELDKAPPMQNYEQNREKFIDLLAFAGRNFPKNLRVTIQSTYGDEYIWIDLDGNETKFYTNAFFWGQCAEYQRGVEAHRLGQKDVWAAKIKARGDKR